MSPVMSIDLNPMTPGHTAFKCLTPPSHGMLADSPKSHRTTRAASLLWWLQTVLRWIVANGLLRQIAQKILSVGNQCIALGNKVLHGAWHDILRGHAKRFDPLPPYAAILLCGLSRCARYSTTPIGNASQRQRDQSRRRQSRNRRPLPSSTCTNS
jgi:hypothetical protein